jgi:hypothetical protein
MGIASTAQRLRTDRRFEAAARRQTFMLLVLKEIMERMFLAVLSWIKDREVSERKGSILHDRLSER